MATLYWVGGTGTWGTTTNRFATSSGGTGTVTTPTAADEVRFDANSGSGTVTMPAAAVCRSLDCNGYTGTLSQPSAGTCTIGDGTAATGNRALRFSAGMTLTIGSATSAFNMASSSGTQQTIDLGGKTVGALNIGTNGGNYVLASAIQGTGLLSMNATFDTANFNATFTNGFRVQIFGNNALLSFGSTYFTGSRWSEVSGGTLTINANTATLETPTSNSSGNNTFVLNGRDWNGLSIICGGNGAQFGGAAAASTSIIKNLTLNGNSVRTVGLFFSTGVTCTGTFTVNGNSAVNRVLVAPTPGTGASTIYAAAVSCSNVDFLEIIGAGAASWNLSAITGGSGDCGGNSNITFTPSATQTSSGTISFSWSGSVWTSRVPLPQDDVVVANAFGSGQFINLDMPRLGRSITIAPTWTGTAAVLNLSSYTGLSAQLNHIRFFGSLSTNMALSGANRSWTASGRGTYTITTNGVVLPALNVDCGTTGTYTITDDYTAHSGVTQQFLLASGTLNSRNITHAFYGQTGGTWNAGAFTITAVGASGNAFTFTGGTFNGPLSTFALNASANVRNFNTSGTTSWVFGALDYSVAASTGQLNISAVQPLTFAAVKVGAARTLQLPVGAITSATSWQVGGTSGNLTSIVSSNAGTRATMANTYGPRIALDYVSLKDIRFAEPFKWYATNSTDAGNNSNAHFSAAPVSGPYLRQSPQTYVATSLFTTSTTFAAAPLPGQLLLAKFVAAGGNPGTVTGPAGWTLVNSASSPFAFLWAKIADGTETSVAVSWTTPRATHLVLEEVAGFVYTPTLDVLDTNGSGGASVLSLSTGSGVTNTHQPAWATVFAGLNGTAGGPNTVPTNGYEELYLVSDSAAYVKSAAQPLAALGSQSTTMTWSTARSVNTALAVFTDVPSGPAPTDTGAFLAFM